MIRLRRSTKTPAQLQSAQLAALRLALEQRVAAGEHLASKDFAPHWQHDKIRQQIWNQQRKKCCYTERHRRWKLEMDVEHFRPKAGVTEDPNHSGYWWLAYEWNNYLLSDKHSNSRFKGNRFPLLTHGVRAANQQSRLADELPILVDPYDEDPEPFFEYTIKWAGDGWWVYMQGVDPDGRGQGTIDILELNELELVEERGELVDELTSIKELMDAAVTANDGAERKRIAKRIGRVTRFQLSFAGFRRDFFRRAGYGQFVSKN